MKKKIKILHIITRLDKGGAPKNTLITVSGTDKKIFSVDLVSGISVDPESDVEEKTIGSGARYFVIPEIVRPIKPFKDIISIIKLYRLIKKEKYDIVHTHTSKPGVTGRIAAILAGTLYQKRYRGAPFLVHTSHGHIYKGFFSSPFSWVLLQLDRFLSIFTDKIITLTDCGRREQIELKIASPEKFEVVPSGIDINRFASLPLLPPDKGGVRGVLKNLIKEKKLSLGLPLESIVIGHVARLVPLKGHSDLLKATPQILKKFSKVIILFVGDGPLKEELKEEADSLGISSKVKFLGHREDMDQIYHIMDILVLPSELEGMGRVILEAMAASCPVAAADVMGIPELVIDGETGRLFPPRQPNKITQVVCSMLENPKHIQEMVKNAFAMLKGKYDQKSMVKKIENIYLSLIGKR